MTTSVGGAAYRSVHTPGIAVILLVAFASPVAAQQPSDAARAEAAAEAQERAYFAKESAWMPDDVIVPNPSGIFRAEWMGMVGRLRVFRVTSPEWGRQRRPFLVAFRDESLLRLGGFPGPDVIAAWQGLLESDTKSLGQVSDSFLLAAGRKLALLITPQVSWGQPVGTGSLDEGILTSDLPVAAGCDFVEPPQLRGNGVTRSAASAVVRVSLHVPVDLVMGHGVARKTLWLVLDKQAQLSAWEQFTSPSCPRPNRLEH